MNIGVFDSGIGGLVILKSLIEHMPHYDYVFFGDTKNVPYGGKTEKEIERLTQSNIDYLFGEENCALVLVACNTASVHAVRVLQKKYPAQKILGVIIPTIEEINGLDRVGILATKRTVASRKYLKEIQKRFPRTKTFQKSAPKLVPMIEEGRYDEKILKGYISYFLEKKVTTIVLGCTHYSILKREIRSMVPKNIRILSQDEIIHRKLSLYLKKHKDIEQKLSQNNTRKLLVTKHTATIATLAREWFGENKIIEIKKLLKN